jgi:hypothetical protein
VKKGRKRLQTDLKRFSKNRRVMMSFITKRLACFTLFFSMALVSVLMGTETSVAINDVGPLHYHDTQFLPGTPPLKKGYEQTEAGIRLVIEKHDPRIVHVSRSVFGNKVH